MKRHFFITLLIALVCAVSCDKYEQQYDWTKYSSQLIKPVNGVSVYPQTLRLTIGSSQALTATVSPTAAGNKKVIWYSDSTHIATVDSTGLVKAIAKGTTIITVETVDNHYKSECLVDVIDGTVVPVTGVTLDSLTLTLEEGASFLLSATVLPTNATNRGVSWSSDASGIATVSSIGYVTAVSEGQATVTVKTDEGSFTEQCVVTVKKPTPPPTTDKYYVSVNGAGSKNGTSWENAMSCTELVSLLLDEAKLNGKTICMAGGSYKIAQPSDKCLILKYEAATTATIEGGYNATTGARDYSSVTTFTGNNQYAIFSIQKNAQLTFDAVDFAYALAPSESDKILTVHGAMYVDSKSTTIRLKNCNFHDNVEYVDHKVDTLKGGSALFMKAGTVYADNCTFKNNSSTSRGGAIRTTHKDGVLYANNCKFISNKIKLDYGTAIFAKGNVAMYDCTFYDNSSEATNKQNPALNMNFNYILASCTIVEKSYFSTGTGAVRTETKNTDGYCGWVMNNVIYNIYNGAAEGETPKAWGFLISQVGTVSAGYNGIVGKDGGVSNTTKISLQTTDQNVKVLSKLGVTGYSFDSSTNTIIWQGSFSYTRATKSEIYDALNGFSASKGKKTLGTDFRNWLREIGVL